MSGGVGPVSETAAMTLTDFLLARIAEDEAEQLDDPARRHGRPSARVLAECEAKRRIVEEHRPDADETFCGCCWLADLDSWEPFPCPTMQALAAVYADHPDYRDEWRP